MRRRVFRRRAALLGGTTSLSDCRLVMKHLFYIGKLVDGPAIRQYESAFADEIGVPHAFSFSSGRVGLYGLLQALGVGEGDEVILQAPTHIVVPNAIRYLGARPVYVDCEPETCNIDLQQVRSRVSEKTRAIILQHTFGIPTEMDEACRLADELNLPIIEDCVHALGSRYDGKPVGSFGRAAFFSTEETKIISTTMGGMVVTADGQLAAQMAEFQESCLRPPRMLAYGYILKLLIYHFFMQPHLHRFTRAIYEFFGRRLPLPRPTEIDELQGKRPKNYLQRLSNAQAEIGIRQLQGLSENLAHRKKISDLYAQKLSAAGYKIPKPPPKADTVYVRFPTWVEDRSAAVEIFAPHLVLGTWFTSVLEEAESLASGDYSEGSCPRAEFAARHLINLPNHGRITAEDVDTFLDILRELPPAKSL